jgi:amidase
MIRERAVTSSEVVDAHLRRIADVKASLNAIVQLDAERAVAAARAADDAAARGDDLGPLHGVPFTVKDWIETTDLVCAAGFEERRAYLPSRDATAVGRMRAAGAILLGKTNVNDGSPVYARPSNPHDATRSPGGSSSGEAAIIAAGGSPLGLGSDSGGSVRLPAAYCGVAGLKPSTGLVPLTGHFPRIGALSDPRTTIGPLARSLDDLALALRVIAGPDGTDPSVVPVAIGDHRAVDGPSLRIAWFTEIAGASPTDDVIAATRGAADTVAAAGATVEHARPACVDDALRITIAYWRRPSSASWGEWMPGRASTMTADEVERSIFDWEKFQREMLRFMRDYDAVITPAAPDVAPIHRPLTGEDFIYTLPWSLTGQPAVTVPVATASGGMPIAVQVIARGWRDDVALAVAQRVESRTKM